MIRGLLVCLLASLLVGCGGSRLLTDDELARLDVSGRKENQVIYYKKTFRQMSPERFEITTHSVLRVGENTHAAPELLAVFDGTVERLTTFEARVIHPRGSSEKYGKGDLNSIALANRRRINDDLLKYLPVADVLEEGALVEQVYTHDFPLARLGLPFSLSEVGGRARKVVCSYRIAPDDSLSFHVMNDSLMPIILRTPEYKEYTFNWNGYVPSSNTSVFGKTNANPGVLATLQVPSSRMPSASPWMAFGDWYLSLIENQLQADDAITERARQLTNGKKSDLEKLEALAAYCQTKIRYEQVYLAWGEVIPNTAASVFARGYGDCKDYSALLHSMARAVGIETQLVLCHRGQGFEVHPEIPVAQFNHMIVHFADHGKDYWFDGTNRCGAPSLTASDLINASALVLQRGASHILTIAPSEKNMLRVRGTLLTEGSNLRGDLIIDFDGQYAVDLLANALYLNSSTLKERLITFLQKELNSALTVTDIRWKQEIDRFRIAVSCRLPGVLTTVAPYTYVSLARLFPALVPAESPAVSTSDPLFFPGYDRVDFAVDLPEYRDAAEAPGGQAAGYHCTALLAFLPGPAAGNAREAFIAAYERASADYHKTVKLVRGTAQ